VARPEEIWKQVCGSTKATRAQMAERIVGQYPHLGRYRDYSSQWQEDYWMSMFAAVEVGLVLGKGG
jgi:hypothetical protein